jgi:hypothetical protein
MKEELKKHFNDPEKLERLYRNDRKSFESDFKEIYSEIENSELAKYWKIRLDFETSSEKVRSFHRKDIFKMIAVCLIAGFLIKLPAIFNINLSNFLFFEKNAGIIFFLGLSIYALWTKGIINRNKLLIIIPLFLIPVIYINLLPSDKNINSINLAYIHLPLLLWCVYGLVFIDFNIKDETKRVDYIRYNGDLAIIGAMIVIAGMAMTIITIGLFQAINIRIEKFYMENVALVGFVSAPIVATFILDNYRLMTNKIARIIANIFSPLVLLTLIIYLTAVIISGKNPFNDRDFLLIFNIMLVGVMAIIVFSISETSDIKRNKLNETVLFVLSIVTVFIDVIALTAILYRLVQYGISPNRLAVAGSNLLILGNLILITMDLFKINFGKSEMERVGQSIAIYPRLYYLDCDSYIWLSSDFRIEIIARKLGQYNSHFIRMSFKIFKILYFIFDF